MNTYTVWIEAENWAEGQWNPPDSNSDAVVTLEDGSRWVATFFSYANIASLVKKYQDTGECLGGKYFWASDMILTDEVSRERMEEVIAALMAQDRFKSVFTRCRDTEAA